MVVKVVVGPNGDAAGDCDLADGPDGGDCYSGWS